MRFLFLFLETSIFGGYHVAVLILQFRQAYFET